MPNPAPNSAPNSAPDLAPVATSPDPTDTVPIRRALISVSDKAGLVPFAKALAKAGVALISTGGTSDLLRDAGLTVTDVADVTGFPEMMDGRVKTLHPKVHGGLLAVRENPAHQAAMEEHGVAPIDLLVVNLYPFEETVARGADPATCIENIDIGGPAMIRAAAKNHRAVVVATEPGDYAGILAELEEKGGTSLRTRTHLAQAAFARTATYDAAVSSWMMAELNAEMQEAHAPRRIAFGGTLALDLRYGENPHQQASFYTDGTTAPGVATAARVQGKHLSYNNINDTDAAWALCAELEVATPGCVIVKHANPCGVAYGTSLADAYTRAYACDRVSAFGGIVALNRPLDATTARAITEIFTEVVIAPGASDEAKAVFAEKKNLRLLLTDGMPDPHAPGQSVRQVAGGFLVQDKDIGRVAAADLSVVTARAPTDVEMADLMFAWTVAKHVKSNAIVYAKGGATVGIGAGQMSRVDSTRIAARKSADMAEALGLAEPTTRGAVVASDAFFPFADGLVTAAEAGATALIQPGGSVRDAEVITAADDRGLAMVFTGMRHFRH